MRFVRSISRVLAVLAHDSSLIFSHPGSRLFVTKVGKICVEGCGKLIGKGEVRKALLVAYARKKSPVRPFKITLSTESEGDSDDIEDQSQRRNLRSNEERPGTQAGSRRDRAAFQSGKGFRGCRKPAESPIGRRSTSADHQLVLCAKQFAMKRASDLVIGSGNHSHRTKLGAGARPRLRLSCSAIEVRAYTPSSPATRCRSKLGHHRTPS